MKVPRQLIMLPGPTNVPDRVMNAMITPLTNHRGKLAGNLFKEVKEKSREIFGTSGDIVVLTCSGTGGMEAAVKNLIRRGDNVIATAYGEFGHRVAGQLSQSGAEVRKVTAEPGSIPSIEAIETAFDETKEVKALFVVYNDTSTGTAVRWLEKAGKLCSDNHSFLVVDAVSNLGGDDLPVEKWGIDVCVTGSQKCLAGPPGLAILSLSNRAKKYMVENPPSTLYFNLARYLQFADRDETPFTPSLPLFYALNEALTVVLEEGMSQRVGRHRMCADAFYSAFEDMGIHPFAKEEARSNTVITLEYPEGLDDLRFRNLLAEKFRILIAGGFGDLKGKIFRIGSMGEVGEYHVLTTLTAISSAMRMLGAKDVGVVPTTLELSKLKGS